MQQDGHAAAFVNEILTILKFNGRLHPISRLQMISFRRLMSSEERNHRQAAEISAAGVVAASPGEDGARCPVVRATPPSEREMTLHVIFTIRWGKKRIKITIKIRF
ncbi:MAG TPA: hypothetical protein VE690_23315 [Rhodopila sp.]|nr:hypothetical protein [Rhodopila sp.]